MHPIIGRFLQEDNVYEDGLNLYVYCRNNPVRYVDPSGHGTESPADKDGGEDRKPDFYAGPDGVAKSLEEYDANQTSTTNRGGNNAGTWDMPEGGGVINGREYSQHALERMAPDTLQVRAELSRRAEKAAEKLGYKVGSKEYYDYCKKYVDPRNIPPSVIEDAISSTPPVPGNKPDIFVHETSDVKVIINSNGKVITVMPK